MQVVQLFINGTQVDTYDDEMISVTSSIQNVRDIGSIFTDFSQQFSLPASKTNNKVFKHFYEASIDNGFDGRYKADAEIQLNYLPFKKGKIKLQEVEMKDGRANTYKVVFYGSIVSLKDLLGEDLLSDLNLSPYDVVYDDTSVINAMSTGVTKNGIPDALKVALISDRLFSYYNRLYENNLSNIYWYHFRYSIKVHCFILAIEEKYGLTFSDDFFSDTNPAYWELYMWLQREKGTAYQGTTANYIDRYNQYPTLSWNGLSTTNGSSLIFINDVFTGAADWYKFNLALNVSSSLVTFSVRLKKSGGVVIQEWLNLTGSTSYALNCPTPLTDNTSYYYEFEYTESFNVLSTSVLFVQRRDFAGNFDTIEIAFNTQTFSPLPNFIIADQTPNIKVFDFLTGLFKMFNLTAYEDNGIIVVKTLDEFYASGDTIDITKYIDVTTSSVKPVSLYKQIDFRYQGLGTYLAKKHNEIFNEEWGTELYKDNQNVDGEVYSISLPFEHIKYERLFDVDSPNNDVTAIQVGSVIEDLSEDNPGFGVPYLAKPILHYAPAQDLTGFVVLVRKTDLSNVALSSAFMPSNSLSLSSDNGNINFKAELNEYAFTQFNQTLFETYYKNYIVSLFQQKSRLYQFRAILPISFMLKYKLNDEIVIFGTSYRINQIQMNLQTGESTLELKNVL